LTGFPSSALFTATRYIVESGLVNGKTKIEGVKTEDQIMHHAFIGNDTVRGLFRALTQALLYPIPP
jgi:hypothetical protein